MLEPTPFDPPAGGQHIVPRRALLESLQKTGPRRLTVIQAPAGYGKTSLGAQWYDVLRRSGYLATWIAFEPEHREQSHFILAILDAVVQLSPDGGTPDASSLAPSSLLAILATRLRKLARPVVLFLDDYHFAQNDATESVVAKLLADRSLMHVKFVLMSRSMPGFPISALRVNGEFRQISTGDLGFSDDEAAEFFGGSAAGLSREQIRSLNRRTEGWAVALQMVRLLVDDKGTGDSIPASFSGANTEMAAYLSEQVFSNLPAPTQRFLALTACLPALSRDLVQAVFPGENMGEEFAQLAAHALPVTRIPGRGEWLRYHPVFHAFLQDEAARRNLDPKAPLKRAALWLETAGDSEAAMRHALLCDDVNLAARIVETAGGWRRVYATGQGRAAIFQPILSRAAEIDFSRYPLTALGLAVVSAKAGQLPLADEYLAIATHAVAGCNDAVLRRDLRVVQVLVALYTDHWVSSADLAALENDLLDMRDREIVTRALALNMLSYNYLIRSDLDRATHYGRLAIHAFRSGGAEFGAMHLHTHVGQAAFFSGDFAAAAESYDRLIDEAQSNIGKGSDLDAVGQVLMAELKSVCGNVAGAAEMLTWALPHLERHDTWFDLLAAGFTTQQRICRVGKDDVAAHASIDRARATAQRRGFERLTRLIDGERAALLLASGDVEAAVRYAEANGYGIKAIDADRPNNLATHLRGTTPALLWTRLLLAQGETARARAVFDQLRIRQPQKPHMLRTIELALIDIRLMIALGELSRAAVRVSDLVLATPVAECPTLVQVEGDAFLSELRRLTARAEFPDVVRQRLGALLGATPSETEAATAPASGLTDRERGVIELLCTGVSNKEIGRRLALSDNTVKFHLRNIYAKLNVRTRAAAVMAARDLPLKEPARSGRFAVPARPTHPTGFRTD